MRAHLRYSVKDTAGNVVRNALVRVYERGTTTPVGDMFDAASGGNAITTLISNAQGEIEAWLTTARSLTLLITDNGNTAYFPTNPSQPLDWPDFSEDVEVYPAPEDFPSGAPSGPAGGVLSGNYPNPDFAVDMATQAALNAEAAARAAADALLIPLSQKGAADGVATLGPDGKVVLGQLPPLAINETFFPASEAAMLALTAQRGDVAVRTEFTPDRFFILTADDPTVLGNWVEITTASTGVTDHGALTGLGDDDHPQYHNDTRGDARYIRPGQASIVNADVAAAAAIAESKLALASDAAAGTASRRTLGTGAQQAAAGNHTHTLYEERALLMGKAGAIAATETDAADFLIPVPFNMTLRRIKVSRKTHGSAASVVQVRRSTDGGASFANAFGSVTFGASSLVATADPADLNVNEGDLLNFSVATGGGTNLLVELIGVAR